MALVKVSRIAAIVTARAASPSAPAAGSCRDAAIDIQAAAGEAARRKGGLMDPALALAVMVWRLPAAPAMAHRAVSGGCVSCCAMGLLGDVHDGEVGEGEGSFGDGKSDMGLGWGEEEDSLGGLAPAASGGAKGLERVEQPAASAAATAASVFEPEGPIASAASKCAELAPSKAAKKKMARAKPRTAAQKKAAAAAAQAAAAKVVGGVVGSGAAVNMVAGGAEVLGSKSDFVESDNFRGSRLRVWTSMTALRSVGGLDEASDGSALLSGKPACPCVPPAAPVRRTRAPALSDPGFGSPTLVGDAPHAQIRESMDRVGFMGEGFGTVGTEGRAAAWKLPDDPFGDDIDGLPRGPVAGPAFADDCAAASMLAGNDKFFPGGFGWGAVGGVGGYEMGGAMPAPVEFDVGFEMGGAMAERVEFDGGLPHAAKHDGCGCKSGAATEESYRYDPWRGFEDCWQNGVPIDGEGQGFEKSAFSSSGATSGPWFGGDPVFGSEAQASAVPDESISAGFFPSDDISATFAFDGCSDAEPVAQFEAPAVAAAQPAAPLEVMRLMKPLWFNQMVKTPEGFAVVARDHHPQLSEDQEESLVKTITLLTDSTSGAGIVAALGAAAAEHAFHVLLLAAVCARCAWDASFETPALIHLMLGLATWPESKEVVNGEVLQAALRYAVDARAGEALQTILTIATESLVYAKKWLVQDFDDSGALVSAGVVDVAEGMMCAFERMQALHGVGLLFVSFDALGVLAQFLRVQLRNFSWAEPFKSVLEEASFGLMSMAYTRLLFAKERAARGEVARQGAPVAPSCNVYADGDAEGASSPPAAPPPQQQQHRLDLLHLLGVAFPRGQQAKGAPVDGLVGAEAGDAVAGNAVTAGVEGPVAAAEDDDDAGVEQEGGQVPFVGLGRLNAVGFWAAAGAGAGAGVAANPAVVRAATAAPTAAAALSFALVPFVGAWGAPRRVEHAGVAAREAGAAALGGAEGPAFNEGVGAEGGDGGAEGPAFSEGVGAEGGDGGAEGPFVGQGLGAEGGAKGADSEDYDEGGAEAREQAGAAEGAAAHVEVPVVMPLPAPAFDDFVMLSPVRREPSLVVAPAAVGSFGVDSQRSVLAPAPAPAHEPPFIVAAPVVGPLSPPVCGSPGVVPAPGAVAAQADETGDELSGLEAETMAPAPVRGPAAVFVAAPPVAFQGLRGNFETGGDAGVDGLLAAADFELAACAQTAGVQSQGLIHQADAGGQQQQLGGAGGSSSGSSVGGESGGGQEEEGSEQQRSQALVIESVLSGGDVGVQEGVQGGGAGAIPGADACQDGEQQGDGEGAAPQAAGPSGRTGLGRWLRGGGKAVGGVARRCCCRRVRRWAPHARGADGAALLFAALIWLRWLVPVEQEALGLTCLITELLVFQAPLSFPS